MDGLASIFERVRQAAALQILDALNTKPCQSVGRAMNATIGCLATPGAEYASRTNCRSPDGHYLLFPWIYESLPLAVSPSGKLGRMVALSSLVTQPHLSRNVG